MNCLDAENGHFSLLSLENKSSFLMLLSEELYAILDFFVMNSLLLFYQ